MAFDMATLRAEVGEIFSELSAYERVDRALETWAAIRRRARTMARNAYAAKVTAELKLKRRRRPRVPIPPIGRPPALESAVQRWAEAGRAARLRRQEFHRGRESSNG